MSKIKTRGFTLIELMIVVTIISILASIAIPSLLRARMATNEVSAIASVRDVLAAQTMYRRTDWDKDGQYEYAFPFYRLATNNGENLQLIPANMAGSTRYNFGNPAPPYGTQMPSDGYLMHDCFGMYTDVAPWIYTPNYLTSTGSYEGKQRFGIFVGPASYNLTGLNSFYLDDKGVVWQRDLGADSMGNALYWTTGYGAGILQGNSWVPTE